MFNFLILILLIGAFVVTFFTSLVRIVKQQEVYIVETLGKYSRTLSSGLNITIPFLDRVAKVISLKAKNLDFSIVAITSDKVNITLDTTLIYQVIPTKAYDVAYKLENPEAVIKTTVENSIRSYVAKETHEDILQKRDELTVYLIDHLKVITESWGYEILSFQIKDVVLPNEITQAMSRVVSSKRLQEAAENEAFASYIKEVKQAEAQKQSRILQGEGLAGERKAIINGLSESIIELKDTTGVSAESVLNIVMVNQYIDMLRTVGKDDKGNSKVVFLNSNPSGISDAMNQVSQLINSKQ
jgi:regulator of protease activity HflC (stomatin/prohibitin superfamily)